MTQDKVTINGETIALIKGYRNVRSAAKNWELFSSATPGKVPIPAEDDVRSFRQYPVEVDPPLHTSYRELVQPWFRRAHDDPSYIAAIRHLVDEAVDELIQAGEVDVEKDFALPLQSRALAILLDLPSKEAETWIEWGNHAFRVAGRNDPSKAATLEEYIDQNIERARSEGGTDLFSFLASCEFSGRSLTDMEIKGITHLAFAGGRDTIIHALVAVFAHLAEHPEDLQKLREDPTLSLSATEEIIRAASPLPIIGRTCTRSTTIGDVKVEKGDRVGLCWGQANHDESIYSNSEKVILDRKPNPHVGFGSGAHNCLGAPHARLVIRSVMESLSQKVGHLQLVEAKASKPDDFNSMQMFVYEVLRISVSTT